MLSMLSILSIISIDFSVAEQNNVNFISETQCSRKIESGTCSTNRSKSLFIVKQNCRTCDQVLAELENIDDECDEFGIQMVKLQDPPLAKRYGIKTFPSLVYFRNGNPLTFDGKNQKFNRYL